MRIQRTRAHSSLWSTLLIASGCQAAVVTDAEPFAAENVGVVSEAYSLAPWVGSSSNFYSLVDQGNLRVCIDRSPDTRMSQEVLEGLITNAVQQWVTAVQPNSSQPLYTEVDFGCETIANDGVPLYDLVVTLYSGSDRAWAHDDMLDLFEDVPNFTEALLHEMGHFFGLADTYIDDGSGRCQDNQPPSVMCNATFFTLQTDDLRGARQAFRIAQPDLYRGPRPIVARDSGLCIDAAAFGTSNGTTAQLWGCAPGPLSNQVWTYSSNSKTYVVEHSGMCLDVAGGANENGTPVWLWECHGEGSQQWQNMSDGTIRSVANGKCLEVANYGRENGSPLQIWDCHGGSNQLWRRS